MSMPYLMKQFKKMYNDYNIRDIIGNAEQLREMFDWERITLDCVHTSGHFDLHQQMAQENLAACFSLSMYLPHLHELNLYNDNKLLVFPIKDLTTVQPNLINIEDVEEVIQTQTNGIGRAINPAGDPRFSTLPGSD